MDAYYRYTVQMTSAAVTGAIIYTGLWAAVWRPWP